MENENIRYLLAGIASLGITFGSVFGIPHSSGYVLILFLAVSMISFIISFCAFVASFTKKPSKTFKDIITHFLIRTP